MTRTQRIRIANKSHKKAVKNLHISNKFPVLSREAEYYWRQYCYFRSIYDAYNDSFKV